MKILVVSDIHGNLPALMAINEPHDVCICLGDLVDYGPQPVECVRWAMENADYCVRGNHDHGAAQESFPTGRTGFRYLTGVTRPTTCELLPDDCRTYLARLPLTLALTLGGKRYFIAHASPRDPMDEYGYADAEYWKARLDSIEADYLLVGHTHQPYVIQADQTTVVNPGSVGLPRDGDPRGGYAIITPEGVELKRFDYPVAETIAAIDSMTWPEQAKALLRSVYSQGKIVS